MKTADRSGECILYAPVRCFPDLSYLGSRFGSGEKRQKTASLILAAIAEVKDLIWRMDYGVEVNTAENETAMLPGQIMLLNVFCSPPIHMANCA